MLQKSGWVIGLILSNLVLLFFGIFVTSQLIYKPVSTVTPDPIPSPTPTLPIVVATPVKTIQSPVVAPSKYGLTKLLDLPAVGISALFPSNSSISLQSESFYTAQSGSSQNTAMSFVLSDYNGGGRRAWFLSKYPYAKNYQFEEFSNLRHNGYFAYAEQEKDLPGNIFYFTAVSPSKMLVVEDFPQNGFDFPKFKSFISTLNFISRQNIVPEPVNSANLYRQSDQTKIVWSDPDLGLKIVGPEWTEYRIILSRDAEGKIIYGGWVRSATASRVIGNQVEITSPNMAYQYLTILDPEYSSLSFSEVADQLLLPSGFCAREQPREDVLSKLIVVRETKIGDISAQLRGMDKTYSESHDCRAENIWLVKAKNGQYVTSAFSPLGTSIKLESL